MIHLPVVDEEFRGLIPPLLPEERLQLEENILLRRECRDPIVLWEGVIIDGHNRFSICVKHGIEFQIVEMHHSSRETAKLWILENQMARRNLTDAMRIEMALVKADMLRERAKKNLVAGGQKGGSKPFTKSSKPTACSGCGQDKPLSVSSQPTACSGCGRDKPLSVSSKPGIEAINMEKHVAFEAGVGEGTLQRYMQIKERGSPQLLKKVKSGELKIGTAHRILAKEILKQLRLADKMMKFIHSAMPPGGYMSSHPDIHARLSNIPSLIDDILEKLGGEADAA